MKVRDNYSAATFHVRAHRRIREPWPPSGAAPSLLRLPPVSLIADPDVALYHGDATATLNSLAALAADAIVTSPPYLDARDDVASHGSLADYLDWAYKWLDALRRRSAPAASLMLNIGRVHRAGLEVRLGSRVCEAALDAGWHLIDELVWHKVNGGGGRRTPYLIDRHEYVYWLTLDPAHVYKGFDEARQPYSPATLGRYARRWARGGGVAKAKDSAAADGRTPHPDGAHPGSVFVSSVGAEKGIMHPTPMNLDLAQFLVRLACPPGGLVVDPFAGSCTTAVAARELGRRAVCIDIDDVYLAEGAARLMQQAIPGLVTA